MTMDDVMPPLKTIVSRSFGVAPDSLSEATIADDVDGWDSLAHAMLLVRIRKFFNVTPDPVAANNAQSLGELARVVMEAHS